MTMFFDSEFDRIFRRMSNSFFNIDDVLEESKQNGSGPCYYGYTMTVGPDGKPVVNEYGNKRSISIHYDFLIIHKKMLLM